MQLQFCVVVYVFQPTRNNRCPTFPWCIPSHSGIIPPRIKNDCTFKSIPRRVLPQVTPAPPSVMSSPSAYMNDLELIASIKWCFREPFAKKEMFGK